MLTNDLDDGVRVNTLPLGEYSWGSNPHRQRSGQPLVFDGGEQNEEAL